MMNCSFRDTRQELLDLEAAGVLERDRAGRASFFMPVANLERRLKKHKP